jgi:NAD(P)H-hydrate epimerase
MKIATPAQMREIDNTAITRIGIPGIVLMENAALKVVREITVTLGEVRDRNIVILAGKGNNGGDAFAAARHLFNLGASVSTYILAAREEIAGDAAVNLTILNNMGIPPAELTGQTCLDDFKASLRAADLVVDGIFGTGFKGSIRGLVCSVINEVNCSGKHVISIDVPSGVDATTGEAADPCIRAYKTVTLVLPKPGLVMHPGCEYTGELVVADIGMPSDVINKTDIKLNLLDEQLVSGLIPVRNSESNKGDYGKVLIITGSQGMTGAGCLAAGAALRTGSGLVYLGVPKSLAHIYNSTIRETITLPIEDNGTGFISRNSITYILDKIKGKSVAALGPGLSVNDDITRVIYDIVENSRVPLVLDADALNAISIDISILARLKTEAVITPHPGEMSRLTGLSIADIQKNRLETARSFAGKWGVVTVLKGSRTIVALPDGTAYINSSGNPGMATAGTGDVLAGLIAGLIGQGLKPGDAAAAGVYLHGLAGDAAASEKGQHGLIAGDVIEQLPYVIKKLICRQNR